MALVLAALLGLGALLVVGNTVRLDIQSRREEIGVLQQLGATDGFIRRPFLYLGAWYGLAAGALALGAADAGRRSRCARRWPNWRRSYGSRFALRRIRSAAGRAVVIARRRPCSAGSAPARHRPLPAPDPADRDLIDRWTRTTCAMSISDAPRVMVVDGSKLVRKLIGDVLRARIAERRSDRLRRPGRGARGAAQPAPSTWSPPRCALPDGDGLALARTVREAARPGATCR